MNEITLDILSGNGLDLDISSGGSIQLGLERSSGTSNYEALVNKPKIEGHTLIGDSTLDQIGVGDITPQEIDIIIYG